MNIEIFKLQLFKYLKNSAKAVSNISIKTVTTEGTTEDAYHIDIPDEDIFCTISVKNLYQAYLNGMHLPDIADMVLNSIFSSVSLDKTKIIYGLVNAYEHKELLEHVPHIPFYDMAITFNYSFISNSAITFFTISNKHMKKHNLTLQLLKDLAKENTFRLFPCTTNNLIYDIFNSLIENPSATLQDYYTFADAAFNSKQRPPLFTTTCENYKNGSVALLNTDFLSEISNELGYDLLLLPASDQAFVIMPYTGEFSKNFIHEIAQNALSIGDSPILTRNIFIFNKKTKHLGLFI